MHNHFWSKITRITRILGAELRVSALLANYRLDLAGETRRLQLWSRLGIFASLGQNHIQTRFATRLASGVLSNTLVDSGVRWHHIHQSERSLRLRVGHLETVVIGQLFAILKICENFKMTL